MILVAVWLTAVVAANLSSAHFGPDASIINAFLFVGLTLTTRDRLHDLWRTHRALKMGALIAVGGAVSFALNADAGVIAVASCAAFTLAMTGGAFVYHSVRSRPWLERSNVSNLAEAAIDSTVFVLIAFGPLWPVIAAQFAAKVVGGFLWTLMLKRRMTVVTA